MNLSTASDTELTRCFEPTELVRSKTSRTYINQKEILTFLSPIHKLDGYADK